MHYSTVGTAGDLARSPSRVNGIRIRAQRLAVNLTGDAI